MANGEGSSSHILRNGAISTGVLMVTALGSYVMNASSKVEPLIVRTKSIEEKIDIERHYMAEDRADQKAWNQLILRNQKEADGKLDTVLRAVRERP